MSVTAALAAGGVIGVRHSLEADHVAAIAALVDGDGSTDRAGLVGTAWGVGHAIPIVGLGLLFLLVGMRVPDAVTAPFEILAGAILVGLGIRVLYELFGVAEHAHGGEKHGHLAVGPLSIGVDHSHRGGESFLVGIVHGLAGTGAFVVVLVATAPTAAAALSFLGAFTIVSVISMGALAAVWGRALTTGTKRVLRTIAGVASVVIGLLLLANELSGSGPLGHDNDRETAHEHAIAAIDAVSGTIEAAASLPIAF